MTGLRSQRLALKLIEDIYLTIQDIYVESIARGQLLNQSNRHAFPRICISLLMCDENYGEVADSILNLWTPQFDYPGLCFKEGTLPHNSQGGASKVTIETKIRTEI